MIFSKDHVAITPVRVEITRGWYSMGVRNLCRNMKVINADKCSPSLAVGTWTSFCSVLMVDRFQSVVWSQSSCPQWNALTFYHKCTHNKEQAVFG